MNSATVQPAVSRHMLLNSWKEIAAYLSRGVRTVQRWEQAARMPVHRVGRGPRAPVFAFGEELERWLERQPKYKAYLNTRESRVRANGR